MLRASLPVGEGWEIHAGTPAIRVRGVGAAVLRAHGIRSAQAAFDTPGEACLRDDRYNRVVHLRHAGAGYYLKSFRYQALGTYLRGLLKLNPAQLDAPLEAANTMRIAGLGLAVPELLAVGRERRGATMFGFLLSRALPAPARPVDEPWPADERRSHRLALAIAALTATLHANRIAHRDLYLCHIWVDPGSLDDAPRLWLLDLQRAQRCGLGFGRLRVKDLAALYGSALTAGVPHSALGRGYLSYCRRQGIGRAARRSLLDAVSRRVRRMSGRGRKG